ncbi:hypothetical protein F511_39608 [Dorcoceras hygrometricum]|uniref:Uncharacterized protein n=1 Tax=Dorcoceras hygrometricum TaxID=472368 RepID=A0A2Z7AWA2_9LAMI|nr:hypothetical protein F511_39608 [Dorcoceras hygrometricum]
MLAAGCPVVGREMLATGFPNDWLDQTMSYQLIKRHRLLCILDWLNISLKLSSGCTIAACWSLPSQSPSAEFLARKQSAVVSIYPNDIVLLSLTSSIICCLRLVEQVKICLQLVVQSLVVKCLRLDFQTTAACWSLPSQSPSAEFLARKQNAVVSIYPNDIVLLSLTSSIICCSPAGPSSSSSACSWFLSFQLVHYAPAGSTWPPPNYEQLTQLWTSPSLIQLPFTMINQNNC